MNSSKKVSRFSRVKNSFLAYKNGVFSWIKLLFIPSVAKRLSESKNIIPPNTKIFLDGICSDLKETNEVGDIIRLIKKNKKIFENQGFGVQLTYKGEVENIV